MSKKLICPKCESKMETGFILDGTPAGSTQSTWVEGVPEKNFFGVKSDLQLEIATYRCQGCGYLESYAL